MSEFECPICTKTLKINKRNKIIKCLLCSYVICNHCQKKYAQPTCMNCRQPFPHEMLIDILGREFFQNVILKKIIEDLVQKEKDLIGETKPLLDWVKLQEHKKKMLLRGLHTESMDARPVIQHFIYRSVGIPCSVTECSGVLTKEFICGVCSKLHCGKCQVIYESDHACDKNILENLDEISKNTKLCPKCHSNIFKINGCDAMHCTHCDTHFNWATGEILKNSSNHHYRQIMRVRAVTAGGTAAAGAGCQILATEEQIPENVFKVQCPHIEESLHYLLYEHAAKVRGYYIDEFDYAKLMAAHLTRTDDLRIKFMRHKISEKQWGRALFNNHRLHLLNMSISNIIELYIVYVHEIQSALYNHSNRGDDHYANLIELMKTCNISFTALYDEYNLNSVASETAFSFDIPEEGRKVVIPFIKAKAQSYKTSLKLSCEPGDNVKQIALLPHQRGHYNRMCGILTNNNLMLDLSPLGTGKTYTTCRYLQQNKFNRVYVCCPASLKSKWMAVTKEYSIPVFVMSYHELSGVKYTQLKHNLLIRNDFEKERVDGVMNKVTVYHPTELYKELLSTESGVCVIFDEIQCIRCNSTNFTAAARALIRPLLYNSNGNKVILISGTPFDKEEHIVTFFRNTGIQASNQLFQYNPHTARSEQTGFSDIVQFCQILDKSRIYKRFLSNAWSVFRAKEAMAVLLELFLTVITHYLTSSMPSPRTAFGITNINSYYEIENAEDQVLYKRALVGLLAVVNSDNVMQNKNKRIAMLKSLQLLEYSKVNLIHQQVLRTLRDHGQCKIVVTMNFNESLLKLYDLLRETHTQTSVKILNGPVSKKKRAEILQEFQTPNMDVSILLCNLTLVSTGIDLDDKHGGFPRFVFVSPTYSFLNMYQHSCRYARSVDTKSNTLVRYVYGDDGLPQQANLFYPQTANEFYSKLGKMPTSNTQEFKILRSLHKKADIVSKVSSSIDVSFQHQLMQPSHNQLI